VSHAIRQDKVVFVFQSPLTPANAGWSIGGSVTP